MIAAQPRDEIRTDKVVILPWPFFLIASHVITKGVYLLMLTIGKHCHHAHPDTHVTTVVFQPVPTWSLCSRVEVEPAVY